MARVLIPKGKSSDPQSAGCFGLEMQDGTKYDPDRRGVVNIDNPHHLALLKGEVGRKAGIIVGQNMLNEVGRKLRGKTCPRCHFSGWPYQTHCPRDGVELVEENP